MTFKSLIPIPLETELPIKLQATAPELIAIAKQLRIPILHDLQAELTLIPTRQSVRITGYWQAKWQSLCVATSVAIELSEKKTLDHRLYWQEPSNMKPADDFIELDQDNCLDLGALLIEYFALEIPDYPRSEPAMPEASKAEIAETDQDEKQPTTRPFADLAALMAAKKTK